MNGYLSCINTVGHHLTLDDVQRYLYMINSRSCSCRLSAKRDTTLKMRNLNLKYDLNHNEEQFAHDWETSWRKKSWKELKFCNKKAVEKAKLTTSGS